MNKILKKYFKLSLSLLAAALISTACNNDTDITDEGGKTTDVTLHLSTRAGETEDPVGGEGIKTLRVIVTDNKQNVLVNAEVPATGDDPLTSKTFTIYGILKLNATYEVLVIANEESLSDKAQNTIKGTKYEDITSAITDLDIFPCLGVPASGLPMCGRQTIKVTENMPLISIGLTYVVSKMELTIHNQKSAALNLSLVSFKPYVTRTALFSSNVAPDAVSTKKEISNEAATVVESNGSTTLTYYFYPTSQVNNITVDALNIALNDGEFAPVKVDGKELRSYSPGELLKIKGIITSQGGLTLECEVDDWVEENNESHLDYSNIVSYTSMGWSGILNSTTDNPDPQEVSLDGNGNNTLTFKIMSPIGATWNARIKYDEGSGITDDTKFILELPEDEKRIASSEVQEIIVKCPTQTDENASGIKGTLIIEVQNVMNTLWEVPMWPATNSDLTTGSNNGRGHYHLSWTH